MSTSLASSPALLAALLSAWLVSACTENTPEPAATPAPEPTESDADAPERSVEHASPSAAPDDEPEPTRETTPPSILLDPSQAPAFERIVLVTIDTLRADHLGCYGYGRDTSPFIDSLAQRGVRFRNAVASMAHTAPSHAAMLTGMHPPRHGLLRNGEKLNKTTPTLAEAFHLAEYETAAFLSVAFLRAVARDFGHVNNQNRNAADVRKRSTEWLGDPDRKERFFLWLHFYDPHRWMVPAMPPEEDMLAVRASARVEGGLDLDYFRTLHGIELVGEGAAQRVRLEKDNANRKRQEDPASFLEDVEKYDGYVHWVDRELRAIHDHLNARFPDGKTLWIVTADHGEGIGSHGNLGHGMSVYNEQLKVPLILYASDGSVKPRDEASEAQLVQHVDLMPTVASAIGVRLQGYDAALDGVPLWPLLTSTTLSGSAWHPRPAVSMRRPFEEDRKRSLTSDLFCLQSEGLKWIANREGEGQFYDLDRDPLELTDRSQEASRELEALRKLLSASIEKLESDAGTGEAQEIPAEWLEELRALGYVE